MPQDVGAKTLSTDPKPLLLSLPLSSRWAAWFPEPKPTARWMSKATCCSSCVQHGPGLNKGTQEVTALPSSSAQGKIRPAMHCPFHLGNCSSDKTQRGSTEPGSGQLATGPVQEEHKAKCGRAGKAAVLPALPGRQFQHRTGCQTSLCIIPYPF